MLVRYLREVDMSIIRKIVRRVSRSHVSNFNRDHRFLHLYRGFLVVHCPLPAYLSNGLVADRLA